MDVFLIVKVHGNKNIDLGGFSFSSLCIVILKLPCLLQLWCVKTLQKWQMQWWKALPKHRTHTGVWFAIGVVLEQLLERGRFTVPKMEHGVHLLQNAKVLHTISDTGPRHRQWRSNHRIENVFGFFLPHRNYMCTSKYSQRFLEGPNEWHVSVRGHYNNSL